jgi:hypothetical protein
VIQEVDGREIQRPEDLLWFRERVEYGGIGTILPVRVARMENRRVVSRTLRVHIGTRPEGTNGDSVEPAPAPECTPEGREGLPGPDGTGASRPERR